MPRKCPNCFAAVPATQLAACSNVLECPSCHQPLEISAWSRNISALAGLVVAVIVWRISSAHYSLHEGILGWALPVLFSCLAYSIAAPLVLVATGDLRLKSDTAVASAVEPSKPHHSSH